MSQWLHNKKFLTIILSSLIVVLAVGGVVFAISNSKNASADETETIEELENEGEDIEI